DSDSSGIFVEIFPIESLPDNWFIRSIYLFLTYRLTIMIRIIIGYQLHNRTDSKFQTVFKYKFFGKFTSFLPAYKWVYLYTKFITFWKGKKYCSIPSGGKGVYGEMQ